MSVENPTDLPIKDIVYNLGKIVGLTRKPLSPSIQERIKSNPEHLENFMEGAVEGDRKRIDVESPEKSTK